MKTNSLLISALLYLFVQSCTTAVNSTSPKKKFLSEVNEPKEEKYWVYCTKKDQINNKKTVSKYDDRICLKNELTIGSYKLSFKTTILNINAVGADEIGYNELIVKKRNSILQKVRLEKGGHPFFFITGFAKIRKGVYQVDLDGDGLLEFALVRYGSDKNRYTRAKIYTLLKNGRLKLYGRGTYFKEDGGHVKFGCPECHTINLKACHSCY